MSPLALSRMACLNLRTLLDAKADINSHRYGPEPAADASTGLAINSYGAAAHSTFYRQAWSFRNTRHFLPFRAFLGWRLPVPHHDAASDPDFLSLTDSHARCRLLKMARSMASLACRRSFASRHGGLRSTPGLWISAKSTYTTRTRGGTISSALHRRPPYCKPVASPAPKRSQVAGTRPPLQTPKSGRATSGSTLSTTQYGWGNSQSASSGRGKGPRYAKPSSWYKMSRSFCSLIWMTT